jgi:hypothetical protein
MCSETNNENKNEGACCNPEHFQSMFEMMNKCFKGEGNFDCSSIMKAMKNQSCCGSTEEDKKTGCC